MSRAVVHDPETMGWECRGLDPYKHGPDCDVTATSVERGTTRDGDHEMLVGNADVPMIPYLPACIIEDFANTLDYIATNALSPAVSARLAREAMHRAMRAKLSYL